MIGFIKLNFILSKYKFWSHSVQEIVKNFVKMIGFLTFVDPLTSSIIEKT